MMTWVYGLPAWLLMPAAMIAACAIASLALFFTRKRLTRNEKITHNDVAGAVLQMLGTVLAVLMSFMVLGVWEDYNTATQTTVNEAGALSDLHHMADALPAPWRKEIQADIDRYIGLVIKDEWPKMRRGGESSAAHYMAYDVQKLVTQVQPVGTRGALAQTEALRFASQFLDARRQRLLQNRTGIPTVLWATLLFIGAVTIVFSFYFRVDNPFAQHIMVNALTAVVTLMIVVIAELDYPFRGDIAIPPDAFIQVFNTIHNIGFHG